MKVNHRVTTAERRQRRVRAKVRGTAERPRLTVFRSNTSIYLQVIDDQQGKTLAAASTRDITVKKGMTKTERAQAAAQELSKRLKKTTIAKLVFDRGMYRYHGRVKAVADTVRAEGFEV